MNNASIMSAYNFAHIISMTRCGCSYSCLRQRRSQNLDVEE